MLGPGSGTIWRCGLIGVGVPCWRKCVTVGVGFKTFLLAACKTVLSYLPLDQDVELLVPSMPCLNLCCHVSAFMIMYWTSEPISQPQLNVVLLKDLPWSWCLLTAVKP